MAPKEVPHRISLQKKHVIRALSERRSHCRARIKVYRTKKDATENQISGGIGVKGHDRAAVIDIGSEGFGPNEVSIGV